MTRENHFPDPIGIGKIQQEEFDESDSSGAKWFTLVWPIYNDQLPAGNRISRKMVVVVKSKGPSVPPKMALN